MVNCPVWASLGALCVSPALTDSFGPILARSAVAHSPLLSPNFSSRYCSVR